MGLEDLGFRVGGAWRVGVLPGFTLLNGVVSFGVQDFRAKGLEFSGIPL